MKEHTSRVVNSLRQNSSHHSSHRGSPTAVAVLGSTGTIGCQTLDVVRRNPDDFRVEVLCAGYNVERVCAQAEEFCPRLVVMAGEEEAARVSRALPRQEVAFGAAALEDAVKQSEVEVVVAGLTGFQALRPVVAALEAGKGVALANKECLVAGASLVREAMERGGGALCPVDSEHSSVFQCLQGRGERDEVRQVILTASGGPFLHHELQSLKNITPAEAVKHPRWSMGAKISVDSATLMNKGLEVIEAAYLFELPPEKVGVLIHPESIVHGFVEFEDGAQIACLFEPDMRQPISYALGYLRHGGVCRVPRNGISPLNLAGVGALHFHEVEAARYPALGLCYGALRAGGTMTTVLNASNEVAVERFLAGQIGFTEIVSHVEAVLNLHEQRGFHKHPSVEDIQEADQWARSVV